MSEALLGLWLQYLWILVAEVGRSHCKRMPHREQELFIFKTKNEGRRDEIYEGEEVTTLCDSLVGPQIKCSRSEPSLNDVVRSSEGESISGRSG